MVAHQATVVKCKGQPPAAAPYRPPTAPPRYRLIPPEREVGSIQDGATVNRGIGV